MLLISPTFQIAIKKVQAIGNFILANFEGKFAISNSSQNWSYYVKPKKD